MFFKVIGKFDAVDEWGRHFINVLHIKENEAPVITKDGQVIIKFSDKYKNLKDDLTDEMRVYHCSSYDWEFKGKKGTTYFCFKIQDVNEYYTSLEEYNNRKKLYRSSAK